MIENEYENTSPISEFVFKHFAIDYELKKERERSKSIKMTFLILDCVIVVLVLSLQSVLRYIDFEAWVEN